MTPTQLTKEIQNIKKFGLCLLVLGLVLVGGFSVSVFKTKAALNITVASAKITGPHQLTIVFNTGEDNLTAAPVIAYGPANDGADALTLASDAGVDHRTITDVTGYPSATFTAVYTFDGAAASVNDTGSIAINNPSVITDAGGDVFTGITVVPVTDGQGPTLAASDIVVDNSTPDPNKVILTFSEPLEAVQAATVGNYLVTNNAGTIIYSISSAALSNVNKTVTLTLATVAPVTPETFITNGAATTGIKVTPSTANIKDVALNPYVSGLVTAAGAANNLDGTPATVNATLVKNSVTTFTVSFSEKLDKTMAENLTNYTLSGTCAATSGNPPVVSAVLQVTNGVDVLLTVPTTVGCSGGQTVIVTPSASITDVAGVAIISSSATKILAATAITFTSGTDTRDYDGGITSTGTPTVTSGSLALGDSLFSSTQTFSDKNFGVGDRTLNITAGSIVIKNGGTDNTANYTITLNSFTTGTINKKQLTHDTPTITSSKPYDGNNTAVITGAGTLSGKVGSEDVSVTEVATYNDASVATGKTITVAYTLAGADQGNYLKPVDDTTTVTGVISRRSSSGGRGYFRPVPVVIPTVIVPITLNPADTNDDIAIAIVPKLPKTGFPPEEKSMMFPIVAFAGVSAISIFLYFARKKQTNYFGLATKAAVIKCQKK